MRVYLVRHGRTAWNAERRYQGQTDVPLSPEGRAALRRPELSPKRVYVSPLRRAAETAKLLFPDAEIVPVAALTEMSFGVFEGRTADEMERDPAYRAWVDGMCESRCPGGESKAEFSARSCAAFLELLERALREGEAELALVAHGGTASAVMERFALPERDYFSWRPDPGCGWILDCDPVLWRERRRLRLSGPLRFAEEAGKC